MSWASVPECPLSKGLFVSVSAQPESRVVLRRDAVRHDAEPRLDRTLANSSRHQQTMSGAAPILPPHIRLGIGAPRPLEGRMEPGSQRIADDRGPMAVLFHFEQHARRKRTPQAFRVSKNQKGHALGRGSLRLEGQTKRAEWASRRRYRLCWLSPRRSGRVEDPGADKGRKDDDRDDPAPHRPEV